MAVARKRDSLRSAFLKVIETRLGPQMGSLRVRRQSGSQPSVRPQERGK